jgi:hypothetical protein
LLVFEVCNEVCVEGDELPAILNMNVTYVNDETYTEFFEIMVKYAVNRIFSNVLNHLDQMCRSTPGRTGASDI